MSYPSLPKTEREFSTPLWSSPIKYRAFTIGQQSVLLKVSDPETPLDEKIEAIESVFNVCVQTHVPFRQLPLGIVEKVFLLMREISVGEVMKINYTCKHIDKDAPIPPSGIPTPCGQNMALQIKLDEFVLKEEEGFKDVFALAGGWNLKMRLVCYADTKILKNTNMLVEDLTATFAESLFNDDGEVQAIPQTPEGISEFSAWVADNVESSVFDDINKNFFNKQPHIFYKNEIICPKCKTAHPIIFKGLDQVFI